MRRIIWQIRYQITPPIEKGGKPTYLIFIKILNSGKHSPEGYIRKLYDSVQSTEGYSVRNFPKGYFRRLYGCGSVQSTGDYYDGMELIFQDGILIAAFIDIEKIEKEQNNNFFIKVILDGIGLDMEMLKSDYLKIFIGLEVQNE